MMNHAPTISIILPVLNEAEHLHRAIAHLLDLDRERRVEIIVVDGDPRGGTINTIETMGVRTAIAETGRARQMNCGAALATGDILLFLHADTFLPSNALALIQAAMIDTCFVGGAFDLGFDTKRKLFKITEAYVFLRTRLTKIPFGDQAIFIRRTYFEKIGGYRDIPIMEDIELMKRIKKQGDRICFIPEKALTSTRRWDREGVLYCTLRNWALQALYGCGMSPARLLRWYRY